MKLEKEQYIYVENHKSGEPIVELELVQVLSDLEVLTKSYNNLNLFEVIQTKNIINTREDTKIDAVKSAKEYCDLKKENQIFSKIKLENEMQMTALLSEVSEYKKR